MNKLKFLGKALFVGIALMLFVPQIAQARAKFQLEHATLLTSFTTSPSLTASSLMANM